MIFVILGRRFLIPRDNCLDEECNLYRELEIKRCQGSTMGYSLYLPRFILNFRSKLSPWKVHSLAGFIYEIQNDTYYLTSKKSRDIYLADGWNSLSILTLREEMLKEKFKYYSKLCVSPYATTNPPILLRVPVDLDTKTALLASVPKMCIFKIKKRLNRKHKNTIWRVFWE